ncbi:exopolysaccharide biosynthesis protein [Clostridium autoethanogenum]|uniref:Exopolysaccharide biosynthesis protein n=1 Tax=Clostridium autoethanogenum TaxID=84023 RepID=A0A3M0S2Y8_9CLOT|nr:glycosyltransferase [Clostridium autoethanogenum]RMC92311.1 exopolysaccharide biosynthesis protein [Clostridium autoethanogenum]
MIPKVIHYCWFGGKHLPKNVEKCKESWRKHCPDYEIIQWDENNFDLNSSPFVKSAYKAKAWAFVSDYSRLKIIYENGGIYLDTDVELVKNLNLLLDYKCYIGVQQCEHLCTTGLGFGAEPHNPVVLAMLKQYDGLMYSEEKKKYMACPYLNSKVFSNAGYRYSDEIQKVDSAVIFPPRYFDPFAPGKDMENLKCNETISIHHYSASWMGEKVRLRRSIIRMIGQERINHLKRMIRYGR